MALPIHAPVPEPLPVLVLPNNTHKHQHEKRQQHYTRAWYFESSVVFHPAPSLKFLKLLGPSALVVRHQGHGNREFGDGMPRYLCANSLSAHRCHVTAKMPSGNNSLPARAASPLVGSQANPSALSRGCIPSNNTFRDHTMGCNNAWGEHTHTTVQVPPTEHRNSFQVCTSVVAPQHVATLQPFANGTHVPSLCGCVES